MLRPLKSSLEHYEQLKLMEDMLNENADAIQVCTYIDF